jgi:hypothetical protein
VRRAAQHDETAKRRNRAGHPPERAETETITRENKGVSHNGEMMELPPFIPRLLTHTFFMPQQ